MQLSLARLWWSIGVLLVAVDVMLSLAPPGDGAALLPDKLVHFASYFLIGFWFISLAIRHDYLALAGVIALGGMLELLQGMTPTRQPEWLDFVANTAGVLLALVITRALPFNVFAWIERRLSFART